jgi:YVTN family beta-propeller protein
VINVATHSVVKTLSVGGGPVGVAVNPVLHEVFVTNSDDNTVSVINTGTESVKNPPIVVRGGPEGVAVSPNGTRVYVTNYTDDSVSVINAGTGGLIATIGVGFLPLGVVVSPDGTKVYVANNGGTNTIQVIDAATNTILPPDIPIGGVPGAGPPASPSPRMAGRSTRRSSRATSSRS